MGLLFSRDDSRESTAIKGANQLSVAPEVGYTFNKNLSLGASVGYGIREGESSRISVIPYIRCTFVQWEHFGLFVDALYEYTTTLQSSPSRVNLWKAGLAPGIKVLITPRCDLTTRIAFIGWQSFMGQTFFYPTVSMINSASLGCPTICSSSHYTSVFILNTLGSPAPSTRFGAVVTHGPSLSSGNW